MASSTRELIGLHSSRLVALLGRWPNSRGPLYRQLATRLEELIVRGEIGAEQRLPAERALADALAISRTTAVAAYDVLRDRGLVERRRGSGTWVSRPSRPVRGVVSPFNPLFLQLLDPARDLIDMTCAAPTALDALPDIIDDALAAAARWRKLGIGYFPGGLPGLREAVAARYSEQGLPTNAGQIVVTSGAQQALSLLAQLFVRPGDAVAVEEVTYPGALDAFAGTGARIRGVALTTAGVDVDELEDVVLRTSPRLIYLVPTFQNPSGAVLPIWARRRIVEIAEASRVPVIDDQVLAELAFDGTAQPPPLACYEGRVPVVSVGSLSKLVWGGLRVGWVRADEQTVAEVARLKAVADLGTDVLSQTVAVELFPRLDAVAVERRRELRARRDQLIGLLRAVLPAWEFSVPDGGQTLWVRLPGCEVRRFAQVALRHGVAVLEGSSLAVGEAGNEHLRLPLTLPAELLARGVERLKIAWLEYQGLQSASPPHQPSGASSSRSIGAKLAPLALDSAAVARDTPKDAAVSTKPDHELDR
jgi:DNA-binding transcriptional MocR family regulator